MSSPSCPKLVKKDLEIIVSLLIQKGIIEDQNFPVLRNLGRGEWEIIFKGFEYVSLTMNKMDYADIYHELSFRRSYTAKFLDGGLLQLMYLFKGDSPTKHRLSFYPSPSLKPFQEDPEAYMRDELYLDIVSRQIVPFPLRFDFDKSSAKEVTHPHCHLTLGDVKCCRIPVSSPLTPRWFFEFVLRNFYQTDIYDSVSALPRHRLNFDRTITAKEQRLMHICVPSEGC